jgi:hypothetical protein
MDHDKQDHSGHGFAEGQEKRPDDAEKKHPSDFARGEDIDDPERDAEHPDFARGSDRKDPKREAVRPDYARGQDKDKEV